jgi:acyl carrier protein
MYETPTHARVIALLEDATQTPPGQISGDTALEDFSGWDSLGMVAFITAVGSSYGVSLRTTDLLRCPTPDALVRLIQRRASQ